MSGPWTIEELKREIDRNPDLALELWEKLQKLTAEVSEDERAHPCLTLESTFPTPRDCSGDGWYMCKECSRFKPHVLDDDVYTRKVGGE